MSRLLVQQWGDSNDANGGYSWVQLILEVFGGGTFFVSIAVNTYLFWWGLEQIGWVDFGWLEPYIFFIDEWGQSLLLIDFIGAPISYVMGLVSTLEDSETFDVKNEAFLFWFQFLIYPWIWLFTTYFAIVQIFAVPGVTLLYLIDRDIFVDAEATDNDPDGILRPRKGLPTLLAEMFSIMALLWGDYTYLVDRTDLSISFTHLVVIYFFSVFQFFVGPALDIPMIIWGVISLFVFTVLLIYELSVTNYTPSEVLSVEGEYASNN